LAQKQSSWETESGLLDDYDFVVSKAWFGEDEESDNNDGRIFLFLRGTATDSDGEEIEDHRERYSTGKNWEPVDDGAEVENAAGKSRFNRNAGLGRFIDALVSLGDDEARFLSNRGEAYEADTFNKLVMHMEGRVVSRWTNDDGDEVEWNLNLPTSLRVKKPKTGKGGKGKASRSGTKTAKKSKKASKLTGLQAEIATFAAQFGEDEHDEFVDQVLDTDVFDLASKIVDDDELHADVLDPDSELWANAH